MLDYSPLLATENQKEFVGQNYLGLASFARQQFDLHGKGYLLINIKERKLGSVNKAKVDYDMAVRYVLSTSDCIDRKLQKLVRKLNPLTNFLLQFRLNANRSNFLLELPNKGNFDYNKTIVKDYESEEFNEKLLYEFVTNNYYFFGAYSYNIHKYLNFNPGLIICNLGLSLLTQKEYFNTVISNQLDFDRLKISFDAKAFNQPSVEWNKKELAGFNPQNNLLMGFRNGSQLSVKLLSGRDCGITLPGACYNRLETSQKIIIHNYLR